MCRTASALLTKCTIQKISAKEGNKRERRRLKKIFKELSSRCALPDPGIDKDGFLRFTELPGLLGEQLFSALDGNGDGRIDIKEFLRGMLTLYKGTIESKAELLFKIFDFSKNGEITSEEILFIISYLPTSCSKCQKKLVIHWDLKEKIKELFDGKELIHLEEFKELILAHSEIGELVLQCIFNALPVIVDECLLPNMLVCESHLEITEGMLGFKGRTYYFQLKNQSLYYSTLKEDILNPTGIILIKDLFVEENGPLGFVLRNSKFRYEISTNTIEQRDQWIHTIQQANCYKNFFDDYEVLDQIGKGAHGDVRLAQSKHDGKIFAVKIISKAPLDDLAETRLRRELGILKLCKHDGLLELKDTYETADRLYIVTDYISGGTLFNWMKKRSFRIEENAAKQIIKDIASALQYLHTHGIIHRDIKLENVLVQRPPDGGGGIQVKIIDFGLSCMLGPGQNSVESVGTLKYASPEVLSTIPYRYSPDVWSLGVTAFILLAGKMPFYGKSDQEIASRIINKEIEMIGEHWDGISVEGKEAIKSLLDKNPQGRITIEDLLKSDWLEEGEIDISKDVAELSWVII